MQVTPRTPGRPLSVRPPPVSLASMSTARLGFELISSRRGAAASSANRRKTCLLMHSTATRRRPRLVAVDSTTPSTFFWFCGSARQMISTTRLPTHFCRALSA